MVSKAQIPNLLCVARMALIIPLVCVWYYMPIAQAYPYIAGLFIVASLTDWLDGFLARKWRVKSPLGAMLDQISDKLLVVTVLVMLVDDEFASSIPAILLILREIWVSGVREYAGTQNITVPVSRWGKGKTALQMTALTALLWAIAVHSIWPEMWPQVTEAAYLFGRYLLWAAAAIAWLSAWQYSKALWR